MKRALYVLLIAFIGCSEKLSLPTSPEPQISNIWLRGVVYDESGKCIDQAAVDIIDGPRAQAQIINDCRLPGFVVPDLQIGMTVTLRISAAGYVAQERTVTISGQAPDSRPGVRVQWLEVVLRKQ